MYGWRHLDLHEKILLAKLARPETIADLRGNDLAKRNAALSTIEPLDLQDRRLRGVNLSHALLPKADFRDARLQDADLSHGQLQGANLSRAQLQGANLYEAHLPGADLSYAQMQGAYLPGAHLQGADLHEAKLPGADLSHGQLQGAHLSQAQLQGTNLSRAQLQGANFSQAQLQGANLGAALFYGESMDKASFQLVDVRSLQWQRLDQQTIEQLLKASTSWSWRDPYARDQFITAIQKAGTMGLSPPRFESCFRNDKTKIYCATSYPLETYRKLLLPKLEQLACQSPDIVSGLLAREVPVDSGMVGFASRLKQKLSSGVTKENCPGLSLLMQSNTDLAIDLQTISVRHKMARP